VTIAINATERPARAKVPGDVKPRVIYADETSGEQRTREILVPARAGVLIGVRDEVSQKS
jgi:hypothetical protein